MKKHVMVLCLQLVWLVGTAQSRFSIQQNWAFGVLGDDLGLAGIVAQDIDKNGRVELLLSSTQEGPAYTKNGYFSVVEYDASLNRYYSKLTSPLYSSAITSMESFDVDGDGNLELLAGFANGVFRVFNQFYEEVDSASTYEATPSFTNLSGISSLSLGDIDNDGQSNIVVTNGDSTYVFNHSLELIKKFRLPGGKIVIANIDQDPALETIYAKGRVVELSATQIKPEFSFHPSPYSPTRVRIADMNKDGINDIVYNSQDSVHMVSGILKKKFRSIVKNQNWSSSNVSDFQLYDYTLDGVPDVFVGNDQFDVLYVYNGLTSQFDYNIQDPKQNGVDALVIANIDNQPGAEIIWTSGALCSCSDHVFVYDMATKVNKWMSKYIFTGFQAFDIGDINNTPGAESPLEMVVAGYGTYTNYFDEDFLTTFDLSTKMVLKESGGSIANGFVDEPTALKIADIDNNGKNEILVGYETSYSMTSVMVFDEEYHSTRSFEIDGMSYVADIEVADIDDDGKNEVIVTSGTNVGGSTHPDEWQNYVYIFDGQSGEQKWRSEKLAGMGSRLGNIRVANIDGDPAKEIVVLQYYAGTWTQTGSKLFIIDGWNHVLESNTSYAYSAFDLSDFDQDGRNDIVAAVGNGKIIVLDGDKLSVKKEFNPGKGLINSIESIDLNDDLVDEYVFSNHSHLFVYDVLHNILSQSDMLGTNTGRYSSIKTYRDGNRTELLVSTSHTLFSLDISVFENLAPAEFHPLTPVNNATLPLPEWINFSWKKAVDNEPVTYFVNIIGPGLDTTITVLGRTHVVVPASLFTKNETYSWSIAASDGLSQTSTTSFSFQISEELILNAEQKEREMRQIYPNPFSSTLMVMNASSSYIDGVRILSLDGRVLLTVNFHIGAISEFSIPEVDQLQPGMYLCTLLQDGIVVNTFKIVKR